MNVLDKKKAADLLNISVRTLDRYISKGILPKQEIAGRIVISLKDLKPLLDQKKSEHDLLNSINSNFQQNRLRPENNSLPTETTIEEIGDSPSSENFTSKTAAEPPIYQRLYEELQQELKSKQERLEGANYRVGQLEGLLKESVPLLDYRKALALENQKRQEIEQLLNTFEKDNENLNQAIDAKKNELDHLTRRLEQEKLNKKVFLIILIILFLLQPLWLIFPPSF